MKRFVYYLDLILVCAFSILFSGCLFDSDNAESKDKGTYTLEAEPRSLLSYPGGGGLFILVMTPGKGFEGSVRLTVDAVHTLNPQLTTETLSTNKRVAEVEIRPDSTAAIGIYTLKVISEHSMLKDTLELEVDVVDTNVPIERLQDSPPSDFVQWLEKEHPEFCIEEGQEWFIWFKYPGLDGAGTWVFLNQSWEMTIRKEVMPSRPTWFLLRRRDEVTPTFAASQNTYNTIIEISVEEW